VELFVTSYVIFAGLALTLSSPATYVAWRKDRVTTVRNFVVGAFVVALPCAILDVVSERQMSQCFQAGISECLDVGRAGMQFLLVGVFAVTAWFNAFFMWRD
jgi:nucleoside permease NupC